MTPHVSGRSLRPSNQDVPESRDDHTEGVSTVCRHVVEMGRASIEARLFVEGSPQLAFMDSMIVELQSFVQYRRRTW